MHYSKWHAFCRARDEMLKRTDSKWAPWLVLKSDDRKARGAGGSRPLTGRSVVRVGAVLGADWAPLPLLPPAGGAPQLHLAFALDSGLPHCAGGATLVPLLPLLTAHSNASTADCPLCAQIAPRSEARARSPTSVCCLPQEAMAKAAELTLPPRDDDDYKSPPHVRRRRPHLTLAAAEMPGCAVTDIFPTVRTTFLRPQTDWRFVPAVYDTDSLEVTKEARSAAKTPPPPLKSSRLILASCHSVFVGVRSRKEFLITARTNCLVLQLTKKMNLLKTHKKLAEGDVAVQRLRREDSSTDDVNE